MMHMIDGCDRYIRYGIQALTLVFKFKKLFQSIVRMVFEKIHRRGRVTQLLHIRVEARASIFEKRRIEFRPEDRAKDFAFSGQKLNRALAKVFP